MKKGIHPTYYQAKVTCVCGNTFTVGSTKKEIKVDVCSACHPVFTGKQKIVDSAGRVEKFLRKYAKFEQKKAEAQKAEKAANSEESQKN